MLLERWKTWTSKVWSKTDTISAGRVFSRNFFVSLPIKFLLRFFQCPLAPSLAKTFLSMPAYETLSLSLSHTHTHSLSLSLSLSLTHTHTCIQVLIEHTHMNNKTHKPQTHRLAQYTHTHPNSQRAYILFFPFVSNCIQFCVRLPKNSLESIAKILEGLVMRHQCLASCPPRPK